MWYFCSVTYCIYSNKSDLYFYAKILSPKCVFFLVKRTEKLIKYLVTKMSKMKLQLGNCSIFDVPILIELCRLSSEKYRRYFYYFHQDKDIITCSVHFQFSCFSFVHLFTRQFINIYFYKWQCAFIQTTQLCFGKLIIYHLISPVFVASILFVNYSILRNPLFPAWDAPLCCGCFMRRACRGLKLPLAEAT